LKTGAASDACSSSFCHGFRRQKMEYVAQRKAVLLGQADVQPVICCCCLQLKIEPAAEAFPQGEAPRLVDSPAKRRVQDELHPSALVEEAFCNNGSYRRNRAQHRAPRRDISNQLNGSSIVTRRILS
jgi:hypothetical protein